VQRIALSFVQPGMILALDVFAEDGTIILSSETKLSERMISRLNAWNVISVYVKNPWIDLPQISELAQEEVRVKAREFVEESFNAIQNADRLEVSPEEQEKLKELIQDVLREPRAIINLAHIERHSQDIFAHSVNVALLATATAVSMGIENQDDLYSIALGALLHDIGKLMIPSDILARESSLNPEEADIYKEHSNWGFLILSKVENMPLAARIAKEHHENYDGSGYSSRLVGKSIHAFSRIVAVAEVYESLYSEAAATKGANSSVAYEAITAGSGKLFDPDAARALLSRIPLYPVGTMVLLTNGFMGLVTEVNKSLPHRPKLQLLAHPDGSTISPPMHLDLADFENLTVFIDRIADDSTIACMIMESSPEQKI